MERSGTKEAWDFSRVASGVAFRLDVITGFLGDVLDTRPGDGRLRKPWSLGLRRHGFVGRRSMSGEARKAEAAENKRQVANTCSSHLRRMCGHSDSHFHES